MSQFWEFFTFELKFRFKSISTYVYFFGYSGFVVGNTGPPTNREAWSHSFARNSLRAVLPVKGSLRRKKRALDRSRPLRRPLRYEGMGDLRNGRTSCGGADEPWLPTKNPEEPFL